MAVTLGGDGALLSVGDDAPYLIQPDRDVDGDPCGAGDRFAAATTAALADGALLPEAVAVGVTAATRFLADGGVRTLTTEVPLEPAPTGDAAPNTSPPAHDAAPEAAAPPPVQVRGRASGSAVPAGPQPVCHPADGTGPDDPALRDVLDAVEAVRAAGGTVVATGGCFDILHAGHVDLLRRARRLGDFLVVCLNSDASVRRLKGPDRPLVPDRDRARVLRAVEGVDAVVAFDDDTPVPLLRRLRPDLWVKGGDYAGTALPESDVMREHGGQVVLLPYLDGRSTSSIVAAARGRE